MSGTLNFTLCDSTALHSGIVVTSLGTAKLQIALKEANETGYWLELLFKTNYISDTEYKTLDSICTGIRVMLIASINTAKENSDVKR